MTKISTEVLKKLITVWVAGTGIPDNVYRNWEFRIESEPEEQLKSEMEEYKVPKHVKVADLPSFMKAQISNGEVWKRFEKRRMNESARDFFQLDTETNTYYLGIVDDGNAFPKVEVKLTTDDLEKCWLRTFGPPVYLGDRYTLYIITTPDDTEIVGWTTIED